MTEPTTKSLARVLIIDDEAGLRNMLSFGLPDRGYRVMVAASGEEAIAKIQRDVYDLVVCDIMMPGKDGVEVLQEIKAIQPEVDVIMATGYATLESAVEAMKHGAYDYISKPYSLDQLCLLFEKALERRKLRDLNHLSRDMRADIESALNYARHLREGAYGNLAPSQKDVVEKIETCIKRLQGKQLTRNSSKES